MKKNYLICTVSEDLDRPGHQHSLIRGEECLRPKVCIESIANSSQTGAHAILSVMHRFIFVIKKLRR